MKTIFGINVQSVFNPSLSLTHLLSTPTTPHQNKPVKDNFIRLPGLCKERSKLWFWVATVLLVAACL